MKKYRFLYKENDYKIYESDHILVQCPHQLIAVFDDSGLDEINAQLWQDVASHQKALMEVVRERDELKSVINEAIKSIEGLVLGSMRTVEMPDGEFEVKYIRNSTGKLLDKLKLLVKE